MTTNETQGLARSEDGTMIAFERRGAGPALILIDPAGGYGGFDNIRGLGALLATQFTVYTYDRRGRGRSGDTPPYAIDREVEDVAALISEAGGSAHLYGFSSGGLLACRAAASDVGVDRLAVFEPPVTVPGGLEVDPELRERITELVAEDRRGEAVDHWLTTIGVPSEMIAEMAPVKPALEAVAHTLVYDCLIVEQTDVGIASSIDVPALVVSSEATHDELVASAHALAAALLDGEHRSIPGEWHGVDDADLAAALRDFYLDDPEGRTGRAETEHAI